MSAAVEKILRREIVVLTDRIELAERYLPTFTVPQLHWEQYCHIERLKARRSELQAFVNIHFKESK